MGQALGEQAASSLHGSNKGSPCFSTSSAQPWWDLGLLAPTLSLESQSLQTYPARCLREQS